MRWAKLVVTPFAAPRDGRHHLGARSRTINRMALMAAKRRADRAFPAAAPDQRVEGFSRLAFELIRVEYACTRPQRMDEWSTPDAACVGIPLRSLIVDRSPV
jgi:hypothetical protein